MNSKQASRYIKTRMGDDLKRQILAHNGAISEGDFHKQPPIFACPRCNLVNIPDSKYCSRCSYPLVPSAFDEIKASEDLKIQALKDKYENEMRLIRVEMESKFQQILARIGYWIGKKTA